MGMTMTQKILAAHAGLDHVEAGQLIEAKLDVVMANDITGPILHRTKISNPQRIQKQSVSLQKHRDCTGILNRENPE